ncbi:MAG: glutamate-1-semialdehyde-2,1-aminomutase [Spirochaetales bacterium]|nr:glutamate-1-semialdehyde-2,1-aminomutase [Spirochaetales bacterium]
MKSSDLFAEAQHYIPGGVNSPVRAFGSVKMDPIYFERGAGSKLYDIEGKEYIDYVCSWGPLVFGHADPRVVGILKKSAESGTSFGANTEIEIKFAKLITEIYDSIDLIRMVSSGTEATMSAVRLARGYTRNDRIIKFEGCYHGHGDSFLIKAGSGVLTLGIPGSPGITANNAKDTLLASFNDIESVKQLFKSNRGEIAAVIVEPIMGNAGVIPPEQHFLEQLREVTSQENALLIFDEVITGFRVALGGAQQLYGICPDLTCLGKIIGGGLPVGAFGGRREIMEHLAPLGPVYQAGTLSGNPIAMAIGYETVSRLTDTSVYERLETRAAALSSGFAENMRRLNLSFCMNRVGSMMCMFFTENNVSDFSAAMTADTGLFTEYFRHMVESGIYIAPSQFEAAFISAAHTEADIERTIQCNYDALKAITA